VFEPQPELAEVRLVLVVAPHGFLLGREVEAAEAVTSATAMSAVIRRWGTRPFSFSAALDPLVAQAAVNLTLRFVRVCLAPTTSHCQSHPEVRACLPGPYNFPLNAASF
jgi:hypothetical protein